MTIDYVDRFQPKIAYVDAVAAAWSRPGRARLVLGLPRTRYQPA